MTRDESLLSCFPKRAAPDISLHFLRFGNYEWKRTSGGRRQGRCRRAVRASRLALGQHDPDYVDAFYGPGGWKTQAVPAAGIDASRAEEYYAVQDLMKDLSYAGNEAARRLINGEIDEDAAVQWLQKYAVMEPARAQQRVKFIQRYRSYVINYNLGEDNGAPLHRETKRRRSRETVERIRQTPFLATLAEWIAVDFLGR